MEEKVIRPWGTYQTLYKDRDYQVKRITVNVGGQLSLQSHNHRSEHWVIVSGVANIICGEKTLILKKDDHIYIPVGTKHRASNFGKEEIVFIETQNGSYLGEDDIIRYEDIYGRK
jgi:mannose-1-phosphate guanylyltransferase / mannose-6-phosphate isomerase